MKTTELVKVKNIERFAGELDNFITLDKEVYTVKEAAQIFGVTRSQIRGYCSNYRKDINRTGTNVWTEGPNGTSTTYINKKGMFLLAILLDSRSKVVKGIAEKVASALINEKKAEPAKAEKKIKHKKRKAVTEEPIQDNSTEEKEVGVKIEIDKNGKVTKTALKESDIKDFDKYIKEKAIAKGMTEESFNEMKEVAENIAKTVCGIIESLASDDNEECDCPICKPEKAEQLSFEDLQQDLYEKSYEAEVEMIKADCISNLNTIIITGAINNCALLGIPEDDAAILVQRALVENLDPKTEILNYLIAKKKLKIAKKRGSLREYINLLADEKFDGNYEDAYHYVSSEMKFIIGVNMEADRRRAEKAGKKPESYLDTLVKMDAVDEAINFIAEILAE